MCVLSTGNKTIEKYCVDFIFIDLGTQKTPDFLPFPGQTWNIWTMPRARVDHINLKKYKNLKPGRNPQASHTISSYQIFTDRLSEFPTRVSVKILLEIYTRSNSCKKKSAYEMHECFELLQHTSNIKTSLQYTRAIRKQRDK